MGAAENLELVRRGYAAFSAGDMDTLSEILSPDAVHSVPGSSPISGDHKGTQEIFTLYGQLASLSDGTVKIELEDVLSDGGNQVVAIHTASAERGGQSRTSRDALLFTIEDGKVVRIQDFFADIDGENAFWS